MIRYYENLNSNNAERDFDDKSMKVPILTLHYRDLGLMEKTDIYFSILFDLVCEWSFHRIIIENPFES